MRHIRWIVLAVFLIIVTLVAGSFLIRPSSEPSSNADKFGVCLHLSDFNAETEAAMVDLEAKWVRIDWIIGEMGQLLDRMSNDGINVLAIIDHNTMNHQAFTLEE